jgi:hypothetical protein
LLKVREGIRRVQVMLLKGTKGSRRYKSCVEESELYERRKVTLKKYKLVEVEEVLLTFRKGLEKGITELSKMREVSIEHGSEGSE